MIMHKWCPCCIFIRWRNSKKKLSADIESENPYTASGWFKESEKERLLKEKYDVVLDLQYMIPEESIRISNDETYYMERYKKADEALLRKICKEISPPAFKYQYDLYAISMEFEKEGIEHIKNDNHLTVRVGETVLMNIFKTKINEYYVMVYSSRHNHPDVIYHIINKHKSVVAEWKK